MTKTPRSPTPRAAWLAVHPRGWMDIWTVAGTKRDATRRLAEFHSFGEYAPLTIKVRSARLRREGWTIQRVAIVGLSAYNDLATRANDR